MFSFGGNISYFSQESYHADLIPVSLVAVVCPSILCEWVCFENDPDSDGDVILGSTRLGLVGTGIVLGPGNVTGWIPVNSLDHFWHKETTETTHLRYCILGHGELPDHSYLLQEDIHDFILQEDGSRIIIT